MPPPPLNTGILLTLGLLLCLAHPAEAQFIGDRIRITTESGEKITGELQGYDDTSLTLLADSEEQRVAYDDMAKLRRSLGRRSYARKGARRGLVAGATIGLLPLITGGLKVGESFAFLPVSSLAGSMIGFIVSAPFRGEQWERLDISGRDSTSALPLIGFHAKSVGDLMRVTSENGQTITGRLQAYDARSLTILTDSTEQSIAYADMLSLEKRQGVRRYPVQGALFGLGAGALVSILIVAAECGKGCDGYEGYGAILFTIVTTTVGTALGLIFGTVKKTETWERLDIPGQERGMSVAPVIGVYPNGRLALGARISF